MEVTLQYVPGCPHWRVADRRLRQLAGELDLDITRQRIGSPGAAERHGFCGSPTILVEGSDPFAADGESVGLSCRIYRTPGGPAGAPTVDQLRQVLVS